MPKDEVKALHDLRPHRGGRAPGGARRLGTADEDQRDRRHDERDRVDEDRNGRAEHLHEPAPEARTTDLGERRARGELAVALDHAIDPDERRNVRRIGGIEERPQAALEEHDEVQLLDPERAGEVGRRDREQQGCPDRVGRDEQRPSAQPVDPCAGDEADEEHPEAGRDDEQRHLERARCEHEQRDERHGGPGHHGAELGHRLAGPELHEVGVSPERRGHHGGERTGAAVAVTLDGARQSAGEPGAPARYRRPAAARRWPVDAAAVRPPFECPRRAAGRPRPVHRQARPRDGTWPRARRAGGPCPR